jgi:hypothetical protein
MSDLFIASRSIPHPDDGSRKVIAAGKVERPVAETPAETIRRAAALIRERAGGCEPRRWHWKALGEKRYPQRVSSDGNVALIAETFISPEHRPYEAEHIASWSPPVALAVAEWLDDAAEAYDAFPGSVPGHSLRIARAYLGEPLSAEDEAGIEAVKRAGLEAWEKHHGGMP